MRKLTITAVLSIVIAVGLLVLPSFAQSEQSRDLVEETVRPHTQQAPERPPTNSSNNLRQQISQFARNGNELNRNKCETVQENLSVYLAEVSRNKDQSLVSYQNTIDTISNISLRLEDNNEISADDLRQDITELTNYLADYEVYFGQFQAVLRSSINLPCPASNEDSNLLVKISQARELLALLAQTSDTIDSYISESLLQNLDELRQQLEETESDETSRGQST